MQSHVRQSPSLRLSTAPETKAPSFLIIASLDQRLYRLSERLHFTVYSVDWFAASSPLSFTLCFVFFCSTSCYQSTDSLNTFSHRVWSDCYISSALDDQDSLITRCHSRALSVIKWPINNSSASVTPFISDDTVTRKEASSYSKNATYTPKTNSMWAWGSKRREKKRDKNKYSSFIAQLTRRHLECPSQSTLTWTREIHMTRNKSKKKNACKSYKSARWASKFRSLKKLAPHRPVKRT